MQLHSKVVPWSGVAFLAAGAVAKLFYATPYLPTHVFFVSGIALVAYHAGFLATGLAVAVPPLALAMGPELPRGHILAPMLECTLAAVLVLTSRRRLTLFADSEKKLRALIASMDDVLLVLGRNGQYVDVPPTNRSLLYRPIEQMIGRRIHDIFPRDQADYFVEHIRKVLDERRTVPVEYQIVIDEKETWFSASVSPMDRDHVIWVARDITSRKKAEHSLQASHAQLEERVRERTQDLAATEERYRSVFDHANDIIFTLSPEGTITSLNPAFEKILGWRKAAWIGRPYTDLIPADQRLSAALPERAVSQSIAARVVMSKADGGRAVMEVAFSEQIIQGLSVGYLALARDVTERELAAEKLSRSERMLAEAQEVGRIGSWELDLAANTLWWSDELYRIFGIQHDAAPEGCDRFVQHIPVHCLAQFDLDLATLYERGQHEWDWTVVTGDGAEKRLHCRGRVVYSDDREPLRVVGMCMDVTEARQAEALLRASEERFRLLARATNDAVWDTDLVSGVTWCGESFAVLLGDSGQSCPDLQSWLARIHPDDRDRVVALRTEALDAGQMSWSVEYRVRRTNGTYATILDRAYIVRDDSKRPVRMLGAIMDLTDRKLLEAQLEQAKRVSSLGRVAASIAHEFNNVLMGIQPNVELLRRNASPQSQPIDNIVRSVKRGKSITDEILRFTRRSEPDLQAVHVNTFLPRWRDDVDSLLGPAIDVSMNVAADPIYMSADSLQITQVLTNLAINARDAMPHGGRITLSVETATSFSRFQFGVVSSPDRFVHFTVTDQGDGISPERLPHIFEPLFTTKNNGTGLGLAISYQIVTQHHGHMFVESQLGRGTSFHVFIPATLPLFEIAPVPRVPSLNGQRVFLVEDEPTIATGLAMLLELEGVAVRVVTCGADAIQGIADFRPDVVVLDIGLPDIDGRDLFREIESRWPDLPVVFSSGHADSAKLETLLLQRRIGFIAKPYEFEAIKQALARVLQYAA